MIAIFVIVFSGLLLIACRQSEQQNNAGNGEKETKEIQKINSANLSAVKLLVTRGAFHYDTFELIGNELRYIPQGSENFTKYPEYGEESVTVLSDSVVIELVNKLIENGIFEMDSLYENMTTCNSMLGVELSCGDTSVNITCIDYQRGCPEMLIQLEESIVELHGKGLKRIMLPG